MYVTSTCTYYVSCTYRRVSDGQSQHLRHPQHFGPVAAPQTSTAPWPPRGASDSHSTLDSHTTSDRHNTMDSRSTSDSHSTLDSRGTMNSHNTLDSSGTTDSHNTLGSRSTSDSHSTLDSRGTSSGKQRLDGPDLCSSHQEKAITCGAAVDTQDLSTLDKHCQKLWEINIAFCWRAVTTWWRLIMT